ncbi:hypothetical protein AC579_5252 [Pseudocercospora musae]|uniref:Uncharacterized protein n=1 Tax=Pseudocercospora musae TaxID=113226 RepID=A0A139IPN6_9PEZI|nr:hypothetical protein AC579_5252 [Pseudocercospora musae]
MKLASIPAFLLALTSVAALGPPGLSDNIIRRWDPNNILDVGEMTKRGAPPPWGKPPSKGPPTGAPPTGAPPPWGKKGPPTGAPPTGAPPPGGKKAPPTGAPPPGGKKPDPWAASDGDCASKGQGQCCCVQKTSTSSCTCCSGAGKKCTHNEKGGETGGCASACNS